MSDAIICSAGLPKVFTAKDIISPKNGGTGLSSPTAGKFLKTNGSGAMQLVSAGLVVAGELSYAGNNGTSRSFVFPYAIERFMIVSTTEFDSYYDHYSAITLKDSKTILFFTGDFTSGSLRGAKATWVGNTLTIESSVSNYFNRTGVNYKIYFWG